MPPLNKLSDGSKSKHCARVLTSAKYCEVHGLPKRVLLWCSVICACIPLAAQQFRLNEWRRQFGPFPQRRPSFRKAAIIFPDEWEALMAASRRPFPLQPGQELIFSHNDQQQPPAPAPAPPTSGNNNNDDDDRVVFVNNRPISPTLAPLAPAATTPSPRFLECLQNCPTTSEYNPVCASNRQLYHNEQKFNCARRCGADIQIVRHGTCRGLI